MVLTGGSRQADVACANLYLKDYYPPGAVITHLYSMYQGSVAGCYQKSSVIFVIFPLVYLLCVSLSRLRKAPELK